MQGSDERGAPADETLISVPAMTCRPRVRVVSAGLRDVEGVVAVEADWRSRTVRVRGGASPEVLRCAIALVGYEAVVVGGSGSRDEPAEPEEREA
jgi:copper chaperone CopZ